MCSCRAIAATLALTSVMCFPTTVRGQCETNEVAKLIASDGAADDRFGWPVSISGDTAIVGAHGDDDAGSFSGSAYIFQRDHGGPDNWGEVAKLTASDAAPGDQFGNSVSISGDIAIVGAVLGDCPGATDSGCAYVFQRNHGGPDNWGQVAKLCASDAAPGDAFGSLVSISGDTAIIGAYFDDDRAGAAYIFQRDHGGPDNWGELIKLTPGDPGVGDSFGWWLDIDGDTAIVGAYADDDAGAFSGSAYIFQRDHGGSDNWGEVKKLTASDAAGGDAFGYVMSISGDTIVVSARHDDDAGTDSGSAYIFQRDAGGPNNWGEVKKIIASDGTPGDEFGTVSISGDIVIVGSGRHDHAGNDSGAVYIYQRDDGGSDNWGEVSKLTASDAAANDLFGGNAIISGDTAIVGAWQNDDVGGNSGSAYIFSVSCNQAPICGTGGPYVAECEGEITSVQLDGSGSSDPDDDELTYLWETDCPGGSFDYETSEMPILTVDTAGGCGVNCNVTLGVDDGNGGSDSCSATVTIADTQPPVVTCSATPIRPGRGEQELLIEYSAWDECGEVTGSAVIETRCCPLPVVDGQVVRIKCKNHEECKLDVDFEHGTFKIKTDQAALVVTATDECGNESTCTVDLCVPDDD